MRARAHARVCVYGVGGWACRGGGGAQKSGEMGKIKPKSRILHTNGGVVARVVAADAVATLVHRRLHLGRRHERLELRAVEIGHTDGAGLAWRRVTTMGDNSDGGG